MAHQANRALGTVCPDNSKIKLVENCEPPEKHKPQPPLSPLPVVQDTARSQLSTVEWWGACVHGAPLDGCGWRALLCGWRGWRAHLCDAPSPACTCRHAQEHGDATVSLCVGTVGSHKPAVLSAGRSAGRRYGRTFGRPSRLAEGTAGLSAGRSARRKYAEPIGTPNPGTVKSGGPCWVQTLHSSLYSGRVSAWGGALGVGVSKQNTPPVHVWGLLPNHQSNHTAPAPSWSQAYEGNKRTARTAHSTARAPRARFWVAVLRISG